MTSDFMYRIIQYALNKDQGGYVTPDEFDLIINQAQFSWCQYLIGEYQQYQNQRSQARVSWGQNQNVRESLSPVIYGYILNPDINGLAAYPYDYQKTDAMTSIYGYNRIRFASQDRLFSFMNSVIEPIATNPIYLVNDVGFQFYPANIGQARLSYVRTPPRIIWGYYLDDNDIPVYDEGQSANPVWNDVDCLEIIARALRLVGCNLQSSVVSQYSEQIKNQGQ